jgi:hypothetical protein
METLAIKREEARSTRLKQPSLPAEELAHGGINVDKPLMLFNITHSIAILSDGGTNFRKNLALKKGKSAVSSGQLEVNFASDQVGDRDEIAQWAIATRFGLRGVKPGC